MNGRRTWTVTAAVGLVCLALGFLLGQRGHADRAAAIDLPAVPVVGGPAPVLVGPRYQAVALSRDAALVTDTATGHCWATDGTAWKDWGSPPKPGK